MFLKKIVYIAVWKQDTRVKLHELNLFFIVEVVLSVFVITHNS